MKHRNILKNLFVTVLTGLAILLPCFSVTGAENPYVLLNSSIGVSQFVETSNSNTKELVDIKFISSKSKDDGTYIYFNKPLYNSLTTSDKQIVMGSILDDVKDSSLRKGDLARVYNFVSEQDTSTSALVRQLSKNVTVDYIHAVALIAPFQGAVGIALGFLTLLIFMLVTLNVLTDLTYITLAITREIFGQTSDGKPKFITFEAYTAVQEAEANNMEYKDACWIYLRRRTKALLIMGICLAYLTSNQIFGIVGWIVDFGISIINL